MDPIPADGGKGGRGEAGRRAARALAAAYRTLRLYPLAHARTADALRQAHAAIEAFTAAYGSLVLAPATQGLLIDLARTPYADDVVADLARALRAHAVPALHLLPGVSIEELGTLLTVLRLPRAQLEREGGAPAALAARGSRSVAVGRIAPPGPSAEVDSVGGLLEAVTKGSAAGVAPWLQRLADGGAFCALARAVDRRLVVRPRAEQAAAWRLIGRTLTELPTPRRGALCAVVVERLDEPWAAALAEQWPPVLTASLSAPGPAAEIRGRARRVAESLRAIHRPPARNALPPAAAPDQAAVGAAGLAARWPEGRLRAHAVHRLAELLPEMDPAELTEALADLEGAVVAMLQEGDSAAPLQALGAVAEAGARMTGARRAALLATVRRIATFGGPPLRQAAAETLRRMGGDEA